MSSRSVCSKSSMPAAHGTPCGKQPWPPCVHTLRRRQHRHRVASRRAKSQEARAAGCAAKRPSMTDSSAWCAASTPAPRSSRRSTMDPARKRAATMQTSTRRLSLTAKRELMSHVGSFTRTSTTPSGCQSSKRRQSSQHRQECTMSEDPKSTRSYDGCQAL